MYRKICWRGCLIRPFSSFRRSSWVAWGKEDLRYLFDAHYSFAGWSFTDVKISWENFLHAIIEFELPRKLLIRPSKREISGLRREFSIVVYTALLRTRSSPKICHMWKNYAGCRNVGKRFTGPKKFIFEEKWYAARQGTHRHRTLWRTRRMFDKCACWKRLKKKLGVVKKRKKNWKKTDGKKTMKD